MGRELSGVRYRSSLLTRANADERPLPHSLRRNGSLYFDFYFRFVLHSAPLSVGNQQNAYIHGKRLYERALACDPNINHFEVRLLAQILSTGFIQYAACIETYEAETHTRVYSVKSFFTRVVLKLH